MSRHEVINGDMRIAVPMLEPCFDACVTDPPYELGFMGRRWDSSGISFQVGTWRAVYEALKDGSRLLAFGGPRTYHRIAVAIEDAGFTIEDCIMWVYGSGFPKHKSKLKPAYEPIVVARKGRASHLNIDECRIETADNLNGGAYAKNGTDRHDGYENWRFKREGGAGEYVQPVGRWPANVILDEEAAAALDAQSGERKAGGSISSGSHYARMGYGFASGDSTKREHESYGDSGGASRFFYCAKANKEERRGGNHPTVKPVALMRYLVRLVTPKGGRVLDPFAGTFKTGEACVIEGFDFTGVDIEEANCETGRLRLGRASGEPVEFPRLNRKPLRHAPLFDSALSADPNP